MQKQSANEKNLLMKRSYITTWWKPVWNLILSFLKNQLKYNFNKKKANMGFKTEHLSYFINLN